MEINPYLNFQGNTEEVFEFYKSVFGGDFEALQRFRDVPGHDAAAPGSNQVMHVSLPVGKHNLLMGSDMPESMKDAYRPGNNFALSISTDSEQQADDIFKKLSSGGQVSMPMNKTFWGAYFGMLTDKFGIQWMVSYNYK